MLITIGINNTFLGKVNKTLHTKNCSSYNKPYSKVVYSLLMVLMELNMLGQFTMC